MALTSVRRFPVPTINDRALQFASIKFSIRGVLFPYITALNYEHNIEPGELRGVSPIVMGVTQGEYKASGSITVFTHRIPDLLEIIAPGKMGYLDVHFNIEVTLGEKSYTPGQSDIPDRTDTLSNCRLNAKTNDFSAGNAALTTTIPLWIQLIYIDGRPPINGVPPLV